MKGQRTIRPFTTQKKKQIKLNRFKFDQTKKENKKPTNDKNEQKKIVRKYKKTLCRVKRKKKKPTKIAKMCIIVKCVVSIHIPLRQKRETEDIYNHTNEKRKFMYATITELVRRFSFLITVFNFNSLKSFFCFLLFSSFPLEESVLHLIQKLLYNI